MTKQKAFARELIDFCYSSPTAFHAVSNIEERLQEKKFIKLDESKAWKLKTGGKYYVVKNDSAVVAFVVGSKSPVDTGFKIVGAHTDSPGFKIKPSPEMLAEKNYLRINTEVYGGPTIATWFDRPLAIAGRIALKSRSQMKPEIRFVNINRPICIIPNIAPHMTPDLNTGFTYNKQTETLPILGMLNQKLSEKNYLHDLIAAELDVKTDEIIDYDLYLYEYEKGCLTGLNEELVSSARIDDLQSIHAGLSAMLSTPKPKSTIVLACFDNEEVGSSTQQGADSQMLATILERIVIGMKGDREAWLRSLASSFIVSADGAHAVHPNFAGKADPTSRPVINGGLVIKMSANRSYTSDALSAACFAQLCQKTGVKVQRFVNRSDMRGGSTIGPISSTHVSINSVDVGAPMLAMHAIRELCGVEDHFMMKQVLEEFYKN